MTTGTIAGMFRWRRAVMGLLLAALGLLALSALSGLGSGGGSAGSNAAEPHRRS